MMRRVTIEDIEADIGSFVARVEAGESVIVVRDGRDVAIARPAAASSAVDPAR